MAQCPDPHRLLFGVCQCEEVTDHRRSDAAGLVSWMDVEVVQMKAIIGRSKGIKANALVVHEDELGVRRME